MLLNLCMVHKQYALLGRVTPALLLVNAFQVRLICFTVCSGNMVTSDGLAGTWAYVVPL